MNKFKDKRCPSLGQHTTFDELLCTFFMSGHSPWAPGTMGALLATILWSLCSLFIPYIGLQIGTLLVLIVITLVSIPSIRRIEKDWGEDPHAVVVDEAVGVWIALLAVPATATVPFTVSLSAPSLHYWYYVLGAFILFRFFDIVKPLGIRRLENVKGGWGVMLDDILSGVYAAVLLLLVRILVLWID